MFLRYLFTLSMLTALMLQISNRALNAQDFKNGMKSAVNSDAVDKTVIEENIDEEEVLTEEERNKREREAMLMEMEFKLNRYRTSEFKRINERFDAYLPAMRTWLIKTCQLNETQIVSVIAAQNRARDRALKNFTEKVKDRDGLDKYAAFPVSSPIFFTTSEIGAKSLIDEEMLSDLKNILRDDQYKLFEEACALRKKIQTYGYISELVKVLDEELFLNSKQKADFLNQLDSYNEEIKQGGLIVLAETTYMKDPRLVYADEVIDSLNPGILSRTLTETQLSRLTFLKTSPTFKQFQSEEGEVNVHTREGISQFVTKCCHELLNAHRTARNAQIEFILSNHPPSSPSLHHLQLASYGASQRKADYIYKTELERIEKYKVHELLYGSVSGDEQKRLTIGLNYLESPLLDNIWINAVRKSDVSHAMDERKHFAHQLTRNYLFGVVDSELWLTSEQQQQFLNFYMMHVNEEKLIENTRSSDMRLYSSYLDCSLHAARLIHTLREEDMKPILTDEQLVIWRAMLSCYELSGNKVMVPGVDLHLLGDLDPDAKSEDNRL